MARQARNKAPLSISRRIRRLERAVRGVRLWVVAGSMGVMVTTVSTKEAQIAPRSPCPFNRPRTLCRCGRSFVGISLSVMPRVVRASFRKTAGRPIAFWASSFRSNVHTASWNRFHPASGDGQRQDLGVCVPQHLPLSREDNIDVLRCPCRKARPLLTTQSLCQYLLGDAATPSERGLELHAFKVQQPEETRYVLGPRATKSVEGLPGSPTRVTESPASAARRMISRSRSFAS